MANDSLYFSLATTLCSRYELRCFCFDTQKTPRYIDVIYVFLLFTKAKRWKGSCLYVSLLKNTSLIISILSFWTALLLFLFFCWYFVVGLFSCKFSVLVAKVLFKIPLYKIQVFNKSSAYFHIQCMRVGWRWHIKSKIIVYVCCVYAI